jgi:hypothetical protein
MQRWATARKLPRKPTYASVVLTNLTLNDPDRIYANLVRSVYIKLFFSVAWAPQSEAGKGSHVEVSVGLPCKTKKAFYRKNFDVSLFKLLILANLSKYCRSSVVQWLVYGPDNGRIKGSIPGAEGYFSVDHGVQIGPRAHLRLLSKGIGSSFSGGKTAGAGRLTTHVHLLPKLGKD